MFILNDLSIIEVIKICQVGLIFFWYIFICLFQTKFCYLRYLIYILTQIEYSL